MAPHGLRVGGPATATRQEVPSLRSGPVRGSGGKRGARARPRGLETVGSWIAIVGRWAVAAVGYRTTGSPWRHVDRSRSLSSSHRRAQSSARQRRKRGKRAQSLSPGGEGAQVERLPGASRRSAHAALVGSEVARGRRKERCYRSCSGSAPRRAIGHPRRVGRTAARGCVGAQRRIADARRGRDLMGRLWTAILDATAARRTVLSEAEPCRPERGGGARGGFGGTGLEVLVIVPASRTRCAATPRASWAARRSDADRAKRFLDSIVENLPNDGACSLKEAEEAAQFERMEHGREALRTP